MKKAIAFAFILAVFTGISSVYQLMAVPYVVIASVIIITVLVVFDRIQGRHYPIYIFGLALSLIWQTSMIGTYIIGVDIHSEYYVALHTIENGWDRTWVNIGNTSAVLTVLTPFLAKLGFSPVWQFKALYPFICAFVPVVLFFAFRNVFGEKRAYFACLFFMIMPMYTMEAVSMVKTQVAFLCVAGILYMFTADMKGWKKAVSVLALAIGAIMSHYTVGVIMLFYLVGIVFALLITNWGKVKEYFGKRTIPLRYAFPVVLCVAVFFVFWFSSIGQSKMLYTVSNVFNGITTNIIRMELITQNIEETVMEQEEPRSVEDGDVPKSIEDGDESSVPLTDEEKRDKALVEGAIKFTKPVRYNTYLDAQPRFIRTAIGLDFMDVSLSGRVFRVIQYLTELLLVIGLVMLWWKRKSYNLTAEYMMGVIGSFILLACAVFLPFFTVMTTTTTRLYMVTLFFIAPLVVVGAEHIVMRVGK